MNNRYRTLFSMLLVLYTLTCRADDIATVTIKAGSVPRGDTLVCFLVPDAIDTEGKRFVLRDETTKDLLQVQVDRTNPSRLWLKLPTPFPADHARTFTLSHSKSIVEPKMTLVDDGNGLIAKAANKNVLRYNYSPFPHADFEGLDELPAYRVRTGHIHPVWSPNGSELTDIHPPTHQHQVGLWSAWTNTTYQGKKYDFWNLRNVDEPEMVRFVNFASKQAGAAFASFAANHEYLLMGRRVMNETLQVIVFECNDRFVFDYVITQEWLEDDPLILEQHRYGGPIAWRYPSRWLNESTTAVTSEGRTQVAGQAKADGTNARWLKIHGNDQHQESGFVMMTHPENKRFPEPLRVAITARGGYFQFSPIRNTAWKLEKNMPLTHRFRICAHDNSVTPELAEKWWMQFATAPQISVTFK